MWYRGFFCLYTPVGFSVFAVFIPLFIVFADIQRELFCGCRMKKFLFKTHHSSHYNVTNWFTDVYGVTSWISDSSHHTLNIWKNAWRLIFCSLFGSYLLISVAVGCLFTAWNGGRAICVMSLKFNSSHFNRLYARRLSAVVMSDEFLTKLFYIIRWWYRLMLSGWYIWIASVV